MTLVGKILTFLILIMSMVFMTFTLATYATHRNWRDMVMGANGQPGLQIQLDNAKKLLQSAEEEKEALQLKLQLERASRAETLASKETRVNELTSELTALTTKYDTMEIEHRKSIEAANVATSNMDKSKNELDTLRDDYQFVVKDKTEARVAATAANDLALKTQGQLNIREKDVDALRGQLSETILKVDQARTGVGVGGTRIAGTATVERDGRVTAIGKDDLVVVSIGSDEGLTEGDTLEVWRENGSYIGRLVVVETRTDTSAARIVPDYLQGTIRRGDSVGTKLLF